MEEIAVRQSGAGGEFYEQAAQIVVDEVLSLERRVRAFSEFSSEPPVSPRTLDVNALLEERIALLRAAHPEVVYSTRLARELPPIYADEDLIKGVLTNLLENAAQAVKPGGVVLGVTTTESGKVSIEVHDSGPGVSAQARCYALRAHHLIQARRHGPGSFHRAQERSAGRRRHPAGPGRTRRSSLPCLAYPLPSRLPNRMASKRILVLDDEPNIGSSLRMILEREGYAVTVVRSIAEAKAAALAADALLLDVRLPDGSGIDLLRHLRERDCAAPAIMISGHGTIAEAVEATRAGAFDFLEKPLGRDRVLLSLKNALEQATLRRENEQLRELVGAGTKMIGSSPAFARVVEQASMAARSDARILIMGESGTGKELLAAHIHRESPFANGPFVKVNCAAIPSELLESELFGHEKGAFTGAIAARKGKFELADGGHHFPR